MDFSNKNVIVTGGTRGIGRAIAAAFLKSGANVAITGTDDAKTKAAAAELATECGVAPERVSGYGVDVKNTAAVNESFNQIIAAFGDRLDILVNNAGVTRDNLVLRLTEDDWDTVIDTDLKGVFNCIRAVARTMVSARSGRIINISSVVGIMGNAGQANYSAAKAGVIGMTKTVARELASRHITVNAIAPGFVETAMTDVLPEEIKQKLKAQIPMRRIASPAEIASAVLFLASEGASYITGQCLAVDGGLAM
jgi:3-oxoacyl-[acyl-carrier protein] reductase